MYNITKILTKPEDIDLNKGSNLTIQQKQKKQNKTMLLHTQKTKTTYGIN